MAYTKKTTTNTTKSVDTEKEIVIKEPTKTVTKKVEERKYDSGDLIPCRSVTQGELLYPGKKSGELYVWGSYGDITEVEYQDLLSLKLGKSQYIYDPLFVIEDEELISQTKWADVKKLYESMFNADDINEILNLNNAEFKRVLSSVPVGLKNAISKEVSTQIDNGTFDSIQKIRIVDEVCGTDLSCLIN